MFQGIFRAGGRHSIGLRQLALRAVGRERNRHFSSFPFSKRPFSDSKGYARSFLAVVGVSPLIAYLANEDSVSAADNYISRKDVARHNSIKRGVWVTFNGQVYDVTKFVADHPGGRDKIMLAAGGALEPLWRMYPLHTSTSKAEVEGILKQYYIGDLDPSEEAPQDQRRDENDPWRNEPERHPALKAHGTFPFNAETPTTLIPDNFTTSNELYYVRHHHPVPQVDASTYTLGIKTPTGRVELTLDDIKRNFKKRSVTMTMQCGGNRRGDLAPGGKTKGIQWGEGAISTATWSGARLSDVLESMGVTYDEAERCGWQHIQFVPLDPPYDASVPLHKGLERRGDVILAYEMNGEEIPPDHGYPIRVLIPGTIGARSVKWLKEIVLRKDEAESGWQRNVQYKSFSSNIKSFTGIDPSKAMSVQSMPIQSAICTPASGSVVEIDEDEPVIDVAGYAWSGGGQKIIRVEVSCDGGETWKEAELNDGNDQEIDRAWAWTLWNAEVKLPADALSKKRATLVVRAVDSNCNQQPERVASVWNLRGILNNAYHNVSVEIET